MANASYKAANMTNVMAGNVRSGVTIAGIAGGYPSASYPLTSDTATVDLDAATFNAKIKSATAFEYWDSTGTRQTGAGDANIVAGNIKATKTIFGTTGTYTGPGAPPTNFTATASNTTINLAWTTNSLTYLVVRRAGSAVTWTPTNGSTYTQGAALDANHTAVYVGTGTSYANTSLSYGQDYYYAIYAYDPTDKIYTGANTASATIGYRYYRFVVTSLNAGDNVIVGNLDFYIDGSLASENISSNSTATIGGVSVTLSASDGNSYAYLGVDDAVTGGINDTWSTSAGSFSSSSPYNGNEYIKAVFATAVNINGYRVYGCYSSCGSVANSPDRFRLEASADNSTWTTVPGSEVLSNTTTHRTTFTLNW